MRQDLFRLIEADKDMHRFLRANPLWYRRLIRNPGELEKFQTESKFFFHKSVPDRVDQLSNGVQLATMMASMLGSMNNT